MIVFWVSGQLKQPCVVRSREQCDLGSPMQEESNYSWAYNVWVSAYSAKFESQIQGSQCVCANESIGIRV